MRRATARPRLRPRASPARRRAPGTRIRRNTTESMRWGRSSDRAPLDVRTRKDPSMRPIAPFRPALALALLLALATGCAKREANAPSAGGSAVAPVQGGTLVYARGHDSVRLDPGHETDGESFKVM